MYKRIVYMLGCYLLFSYSYVIAQEKKKDLTRMPVTNSIVKDTMNYENILLPDLDVLFESLAATNPLVQYYRSQKNIEECTLTSIKRTWLNYVRLVGGYQYGQLWENNFSVDPSQASGSVSRSGGNNQSYYNVGVSVIMPLQQIFDRGNMKKRQQEIVDQTQFEIERYLAEQKLLIVNSYTIAEKWLNLLHVRAEALKFAEAQFRLSQDNFIQNKIDASDLSRMKNIHSDALGDYEITRSELKEALLRLEILSGHKILK